MSKRILSIILSLALIMSATVVFAKADSVKATVVDSQSGESSVIQANSVEQAMELLTEKDTAHKPGSAGTHGEWTCKTECNGECGYTPIIVVPGIMQSQVYVTDTEGNDLLTVDGFPIVEGMDTAFMFDETLIMTNLKKMAWTLIKNLLTGNKDALIDNIIELMDGAVESHYFNPDGTRKYGVSVDEYWYSIEESKNHPDKSYNYSKGYKKDKDGNVLPTTKFKTEYDFITYQVDISGYADLAGYDHAYYYAYSSFGDIFEYAEKLNDYVQMVKTETGHDKVNIVFISLGGTIGNAYLSEYCNPDDIDRIVFAAAAVDGSYLLSDIIGANLSVDNGELLYSQMFPELIKIMSDEYVWAGYLASLAIRLIPQRLLTGFATEAFERLVNEVLNKLCANCQSMWALVPSSEYPALSQKLLSDDAHAPLKVATDRYYNIQKNAKQMFQDKVAQGMEIFVVCGYGLALPTVFEHYYYSSDNIIQTASTSIGATVAKWGETLPADYAPSIDKSYISPDNTVDAGTAALPDRTWFVKGQSHLKLPEVINDTIQLCIDIAINKDITDSRVNNGGYAQFNNYRDLLLIENMMRTYNGMTPEQIDASGSAAKVERLKAAYKNACDVYESLVWDPDVSDSAEEELYTAMYNLKLLWNQDDAQSPFVKYKLIPGLEKFFKFLSDTALKVTGSKDYVPFI